MAKTFKSSEELKVHLFSTFGVTIQIRDRICGGIPKHPDVIEAWIRTIVKDENRVRNLLTDMRESAAIPPDGGGPEAQPVLVSEITRAVGSSELTDEQMRKLKESAWNGFKVDETDGLYIEGRQIKSMLKEAANILKAKLDITAFKARVAERFFVQDDPVYLNAHQPDGTIDGVVHAITPQGPISALKKTDYVLAPRLTFTVKIFAEPFTTKVKKNKIAPAALLPILLDYSSELGLGSDRSQGHGRFDVVDIVEVLSAPDIGA